MTDLARSYFHRTSLTPLLDDTLGGALDKASERWPDREAVVIRDQGVRLTFAELRQEVDRLATGLIALGLAPGDRVALWSPNRSEWVLTQYATAKAGLILVNLNPGYRVAELEYALNKVECRALITADQFKTTNYIELIRSLAPELADCPTGRVAGHPPATPDNSDSFRRYRRTRHLPLRRHTGPRWSNRARAVRGAVSAAPT